jgi:hypothetical protein
VSLCFRLIAVEFARFPIRFLDRKPFDMGIAEDKPRQLAPTVGTTGSGSTDSPAPSHTTSKIDIDTVVGIAVPNNDDTTSKIDIDTVVGIAVPNNDDITSKIDIDTVVGIAVPTNVDDPSKIDINTTAGIAVPAIVNASPMEPKIGTVDSTVVDSVSPSTATSLRRRTSSNPLQAR